MQEQPKDDGTTVYTAPERRRRADAAVRALDVIIEECRAELDALEAKRERLVAQLEAERGPAEHPSTFFVRRR